MAAAYSPVSASTRKQVATCVLRIPDFDAETHSMDGDTPARRRSWGSDDRALRTRLSASTVDERFEWHRLAALITNGLGRRDVMPCANDAEVNAGISAVDSDRILSRSTLLLLQSHVAAPGYEPAGLHVEVAHRTTTVAERPKAGGGTGGGTRTSCAICMVLTYPDGRSVRSCNPIKCPPPQNRPEPDPTDEGVPDSAVRLDDQDLDAHVDSATRAFDSDTILERSTQLLAQSHAVAPGYERSGLDVKVVYRTTTVAERPAGGGTGSADSVVTCEICTTITFPGGGTLTDCRPVKCPPPPKI